MNLTVQPDQQPVNGARTETSLQQSLPEGQEAFLHEPQLPISDLQCVFGIPFEHLQALLSPSLWQRGEGFANVQAENM